MAQILQILQITVKTGKSKKSGNDYAISEAHSILMNEAQEVEGVGVYVVPKDLEAVVKPGFYTATFAMRASTFGDGAGQIQSVISGLTPVPDAMLRRTPSVAVAAPPATRSSASAATA